MNPDDVPVGKPPVTGFPDLPDEPGEHGFPTDLSAPLTKEEVEACHDMNWAMFDPEIQELYEGKIIAIHKRRVIAVGEDWKTVIDEAIRVSGLPRNFFAVVSIPDTASFFGCY